MATLLKQILVCTLLCTLVLGVSSRYVTKRQYQQQQQEFDDVAFDQNQDEFAEFNNRESQQQQQQQQGAVVPPEAEIVESQQQQQQQGALVPDDDSEIVQLAVEEAEQNPGVITQDLNNQELNQFGQDLEKFEGELEKESEQAGHKGVVLKEDIQQVQAKYEKKPWYIRLRNWAGRKLSELTDTITKY